jgi:two-component system, NtrC family, sensor kinase
VRPRLTVRGKLVLSSLVLLVIVSYAFTAASLYFSEQLVEEELRERAITFAREVAATIGDRREFENSRLLDSEIRRIREARQNVRNIDFLALDEGGGWPRLLASSDAAWRPVLTSSQVRDLRKGGVLARLVEQSDGRHWEAVAPIVLDGAVAGAVAVEFSLEYVDRQLARVRRTSLAITGVSVLVAVGLLGLVVRRVVHGPIRELLQVIDRVERGERDARAPAARRDEFGALASHFNGMLAQLAHASAAQDERVRQATAELAERYAEVRRLNEGLFQTQRRLRHSDRLALLGRTLGMVAHEVGTPLQSIAGHLELLRQELPPPVLQGSAARRLGIVHSQLQRVTETIEQLLAAARRPAGIRVALELDAVVREVLDLVSPGVAAAAVRVEWERGAAPRIEGDGWQLQQALLNLVTNALDAMPGGGSLRLRTGAERRDGREWAFVRIADSGSGIAPDHLKRIFEPFFTTKEPGKGSGLGLFITEQVVRDHGGEIDAESAPGQGTSFTLGFPGVFRDPPEESAR